MKESVALVIHFPESWQREARQPPNTFADVCIRATEPWWPISQGNTKVSQTNQPTQKVKRVKTVKRARSKSVRVSYRVRARSKTAMYTWKECAYFIVDFFIEQTLLKS